MRNRDTRLGNKVREARLDKNIGTQAFLGKVEELNQLIK